MKIFKSNNTFAKVKVVDHIACITMTMPYSNTVRSFNWKCMRLVHQIGGVPIRYFPMSKLKEYVPIDTDVLILNWPVETKTRIIRKPSERINTKDL